MCKINHFLLTLSGTAFEPFFWPGGGGGGSQARILKSSITKKAYVARERTCEANPASENSLLIFTVCVKSVPIYHAKLAYVVLHPI